MAATENNGTPLLSVVIPVFNEVRTIDRIIAAVQAVELDLEVIVVDDFSTDGTRDRLAGLARDNDRLHVLLHDRNQGKGAALRTGFDAARGRFVIVQDADLEYDPNDFHKLIKPLLDDEADVVYGSRFSDLNGEPFTLHTFGNQVLTWLSNKRTGLKLTDMETCYKMFRRDIIHSVEVEENRFGFEPEITAKISQLRINNQPIRVIEVPVSYEGRTNREGKKIGWRDGFRAIWCIFKYGR
jgi:glycosyltransferase involved in cell wall biosynthesis